MKYEPGDVVRHEDGDFGLVVEHHGRDVWCVWYRTLVNLNYGQIPKYDGKSIFDLESRVELVRRLTPTPLEYFL